MSKKRHARSLPASPSAPTPAPAPHAAAPPPPVSPEQRGAAAVITPQTPTGTMVQETTGNTLDPAFSTSHPVMPSAVDPNPPPIMSAPLPRPLAGVDQVPPADPVHDPAFHAVHPKPGHDTFLARDTVANVGAKITHKS